MDYQKVNFERLYKDKEIVKVDLPACGGNWRGFPAALQP